MIVEGSPSRAGTGTAFVWLLLVAVFTDPGVQPFCLKTLAVCDLTTKSLGSVNRVTLDVVSCVLWPAASGRRASTPRVLATTTCLPLAVIPEGK